MITRQDLDEAIMECQGQRNPDANTCIKLAAFLTIRAHMYPDVPTNSAPIENKGYSYGQGSDAITYTGDSEFANAVYGKKQSEVMPVVDELMDAVKVLNPRLYAGAMRKL